MPLLCDFGCRCFHVWRHRPHESSAIGASANPCYIFTEQSLKTSPSHMLLLVLVRARRKPSPLATQLTALVTSMVAEKKSSCHQSFQVTVGWQAHIIVTYYVTIMWLCAYNCVKACQTPTWHSQIQTLQRFKHVFIKPMQPQVLHHLQNGRIYNLWLAGTMIIFW